MSFADAETRAAASVMGRMANATASFNGGAAASVIFDEAYAMAAAGSLGLASTSPAITIFTSDLPASPEGTPVVVRGVSYTVAEHRPDGAGLSVLLLEKA